MELPWKLQIAVLSQYHLSIWEYFRGEISREDAWANDTPAKTICRLSRFIIPGILEVCNKAAHWSGGKRHVARQSPRKSSCRPAASQGATEYMWRQTLTPQGRACLDVRSNTILYGLYKRLEWPTFKLILFSRKGPIIWGRWSKQADASFSMMSSPILYTYPNPCLYYMRRTASVSLMAEFVIFQDLWHEWEDNRSASVKGLTSLSALRRLVYFDVSNSR